MALYTATPHRNALCAAIVNNVRHRDKAWRTWLATELNHIAFEDRRLDDLLAMAETVGVPTAVLEQAASYGDDPIPEQGRHHCGRCLDARWVEQMDGRFDRCPTCNYQPVEASA